jgi:hypothetical protein
MPARMKVEQARRRSPLSVAIQQSWHAPIMQKPARGWPLNSLRRRRRVGQHGGQHRIAFQRRDRTAVQDEADRSAIAFGQPHQLGLCRSRGDS